MTVVYNRGNKGNNDRKDHPMARRQITQFFDDIDDTPLEADTVNTVEFSYKGSDYVLDLSDDNALAFAEALEPYLNKATKVAKSRSTARAASSNAPKSDPKRNKRIRDWARDNGHTVSSRGQISHEIIAEYELAHPEDK
jgi:hypothetical protein